MLYSPDTHITHIGKVQMGLSHTLALAHVLIELHLTQLDPGILVLVGVAHSLLTLNILLSGIITGSWVSINLQSNTLASWWL